MSHVLKKFSRLLLKHPKTVILISVFLTIFSLPSAIHLFQNVKTDFAALLPKNQPSVKRVEEIGERFGSIKNLIIVFETKNKDIIPNMFLGFERKLKTIPAVTRVRYRIPGYDFFNKNKLLYLSQKDLLDLKDQVSHEIQKRKLGDLYIDLEGKESKAFENLRRRHRFPFGASLKDPFLNNPEQTVFLFEVFPEAGVGTSVAKARSFFELISNAVQEFDPKRHDPGIKVSYSGGVKGVVEEYNSIMKDIKIAGIVSWTLIILFLIIYFRNISLTIVCLIPLVMGLVWTFALSYCLVGQLNMITAFLFSVLAGLGIDIGIHYATRYFEMRRASYGQDEAFSMMLSSTGQATGLAAITTIAAFSVLMISDFRGFSEFGFIAALGMILIYFSYTLMMIPLIKLTDNWGLIKREESVATHMIHPLGFMRNWKGMRFSKFILWIFVFLMILSIWAILHEVDFDYNFAALKAQIGGAKETNEKTFSVYQAKSFPALLLAKNSDEAKMIKEHLETYTKQDRSPTIAQVITLSDLVPKAQEEKIQILKDIRKILTGDTVIKIPKTKEEQGYYDELMRATDVTTFSIQDVPDEVKKIFYGAYQKDDEQFVLIRPALNLDLEDGRDSLAFAQDIRNIQVGEKVFHGVNHNLIFADLLMAVTRDGRLAIGLSILSVFVLLTLAFRSIRQAVIVILPLFVGALLMFLVMWICGVKLNLFNIVVLPCIFGLGIDHSVHLHHRFQENGFSNMVPTLMETGTAVIMAVITTIAGFSGLILAAHRGLHSTGVLAAIGLTTTLVTALIFFPAFLSVLQGFKKSLDP